jgi:4'-phosphopantetheinyl transferase
LTPLFLTPLASPHPNLTLKLLDIRQQSYTASLFEILNAEERAHAKRYRQQRDQLHFLYARSAVRYCLAELLNTQPQSVVFTHSQHGKPLLAQQHTLCFNVSHSGDYVLLGFHPNHPIGVDIEEEKTPTPFEIMPSLFSMAEQRYCQTSNKSKHFYQIWTAKEAVLKAWGTGFSAAAQDFSVINQDLSWAQPLTKQTQVWRITLPEGYAGAVALQAQ